MANTIEYDNQVLFPKASVRAFAGVREHDGEEVGISALSMRRKGVR